MSTHSIDFRVYYEDTDAGGIVYHARYLAFAERARTEAIRSLGHPVSELERDHGLVFVVRDVHLSYKAPLRLDDVLSIHTRLTELGAASCRLEQIVTKGDQHCALVDVKLACIRTDNGRPARFPPSWHALLRQLTARD
ncbi:tol-pal system-associated acyl-CoA thioesterase [Acetobacter vaccinii]|uniref:Tol-pal system-associated acyl-CoA thioesterase n=1 Tax=Acetobacter vaccinii TaxID=2592655 RepID=A0A5C1YMC9_9PROT|nr:tol-pal system-associated acyl-CoA thioesterase [Acetobacter vaccinii]QEO17131.1 tol-pal system-associated acyl-CoA thioesterase [Acetobacter vaccinii]